MSLCKAPHLTPELLVATRQNARHSTGPRSAAAKMRLRKESTYPTAAPAGQEVGARMENMEGAPGSASVSHSSQSVEAVENLKVKERRGNVIENKGSEFERPGRAGNVIENKGSYAKNSGM
jgi:hypothetical protein